MLFSKIDVNKVEWLNLVFENRNQAYGAYVLRRDSGNYLFKSLLITSLLFGGAALFTTINSKAKVDDPVVSIRPTINPDEIYVIPVDVVPPKPEPTQPKNTSAFAASSSDAALQQVKFSGKLNPVRDNLATAEVPSIKQMEESVIALQASDGLTAGTANNQSSLNGDRAGGVGEGISAGTEIYSTKFLEVMPEFPGGMKAWAKFLMRNLNYPVVAAENGISGQVLVSFVVEKNGEVSNLKVIRGIGGGCDEEAMRVIKKSPFWKPGMQNGQAVRVSYVIPVVFRME